MVFILSDLYLDLSLVELLVKAKTLAFTLGLGFVQRIGSSENLRQKVMSPIVSWNKNISFITVCNLKD